MVHVRICTCTLWYMYVYVHVMLYMVHVHVVWCMYMLYGACTCCIWYMYMLYMVHVHVVYGACTCCIWYMYMLHMVHVQVHINCHATCTVIRTCTAINYTVIMDVHVACTCHMLHVHAICLHALVCYFPLASDWSLLNQCHRCPVAQVDTYDSRLRPW